MLKFYGEKCPVCGKEFVVGDDIVVCPICGTPHHRECYEKENKCANEIRHDASWEWKGEREQNIAQNPKANQMQNNEKQTMEQKITTAQIMANQLGLSVGSNENSQKDKKEFLESDEIDGVQTQHLMFYIRKNPLYFLDKWKRNRDKKFFVSFNWSAFFFSFVYFYYRKMYRAGSLILLGIALSLIPTFSLTMKVMPQLAPHVGEIMLNPSLVSSFIDPTGLEGAFALVRICSMIPLLLSFVGGLVFNSLYRTKVVKETSQIIKNGGDVRMLLLKGGVSFVNAVFIICFAIFMFFFSTQFLALGM